MKVKIEFIINFFLLKNMSIYSSFNRINKYIKHTPLEFNMRFSEKFNCNVYFKREDLQINRSFKIRGVYNKVLKLKNKKTINNIVCASAGNHAQGISHICNKLKIKGHIFLPVGTPNQKISRIKNIGMEFVDINLIGNNFNESLNSAVSFSKKNEFDFIHPFNDLDIINGQGTIYAEIRQELNPDIIISCVGGGGLVSGLINYRNYYNDDCKIYGVEPENANSMTLALEKNKPIHINNIDTFVDGAAVSEVGNINFNIVKNGIDKMLTVDNGLLCSELVNIYQEEGIVLEPAGALSISCLNKLRPDEIINKNIVCILSGGNNDIMRYNEILEHKLFYDGLKHYFIIRFNQSPGQLKLFLNKILGKNDDIVRFEYLKKSNKSFGNALIGIQLIDRKDIKNIIKNLNYHGVDYIKLNKNDLLYNYIV